MSLLACGSSSNANPSNDAATESVDSAEPATACTPFGLAVCGRAGTCCFSDMVGTCANRTACTSPLHFECSGPASCDAGEVCCADIPLDASAQFAEGGQLALVGVAATSACATRCPPPSFSLCNSRADCPAAASCDQLPEGNSVLLALGAETLTVCASDAGVGASEDGGLPEASASPADGSAVDSGD
jgi:hypothetical protein